MTKKEIKTTVLEIYKGKGLNSVYAFLRKNDVDFRKNVVEFGLDNLANSAEKIEWIKSGDLRFHYYSQLVTSRKTGYQYNRIRGIEIELI